MRPVCRQRCDEIGQLQEILGPEAAPSCCRCPERIRPLDARPTDWHVVQPALVVAEVDAVFAPGLPVLQELELTAVQGMEQVRHLEASARIPPISCS
jgi:hypothetical protein